MKKVFLILIIIVISIISYLNIFAYATTSPVNSYNQPYYTKVSLYTNGVGEIWVIYSNEKVVISGSGSTRSLSFNGTGRTFNTVPSDGEDNWHNVTDDPTCNSFTNMTFYVPQGSFLEANYDVYEGENLLYGYEDYYVNEDFLNTTEINSIKEIEKKFEKNYKMQFFIKAHSNDYTAGQTMSSIIGYANTKSPSGNGTFVIDIYKNTTNKTVKITITESALTAIQVPAKAIILNLTKFMKNYNDFNINNLNNGLDSVYTLFSLQDDYDIGIFGVYDFYGTVEGYSLINNKLPINNYFQPDNHSSDEASIILSETNIIIPTIPPEPSPLPSPIPELPNDDNEGDGFISGLWAILVAILKLIGAFFGLIIKAFTYVPDLHGLNGGKHTLLNQNMIDGLDFLKDFDLPYFHMSIWNFIELTFSSLYLFFVIKILMKIAKRLSYGG